MKDLCEDLRNEYTELSAMLDTLTPAQWAAQTAFYRWTPYDEVAHLCLFEQLAVTAMTDAERFRRVQTSIAADMAAGEEISGIARKMFAGDSGGAVNRAWRGWFTRVCDLLDPMDPKARLPWFGPDMSARSFATARLMETWAHGQDIYDALRRRRAVTRRLRHIAHLGVSTFGWTFINRGLPVPSASPSVELTVPDGTVWKWNETSSSGTVRGTAEDFCLVVTQRRHVADTTLEVDGEGATGWMNIAQCFAGPPADGPAAGARRVEYRAEQPA